MLKSNDIEKKSTKSCKIGVILVIIMIYMYISHFCHVFLHLLIELTYLNNRNTNKPENLHVYIILFSSGHVHNVVIFSLTLLLLVLLIVISQNNAL